MQELQPKNAVTVFKDSEIDKQITTAKMYPREIEHVYAQCVSLATIDKDTAEGCVYALPRGKDDNGKAKFIRGPSIRLAEICASNWGNLRLKSGIKSNDSKRITAEATAWDLETNYAVTRESQRNITTKTGSTYSEDMQTTTGNAAIAIAERNAIFKVIPLSFVNAVMGAANKKAIGLTGDTLPVRIEKMLAYFVKIGMSKEAILGLIQKPTASDMDEEDLLTLRGIANALKDGQLKIDDLLEPVTPESETTNMSKAQELTQELLKRG